MLEKLDDHLGKPFRLLGDANFAAIAKRQALGPDRRSDHRLGHRHSFWNLDARSSPNPQWNHYGLSLRKIRSNIGDSSSDFYSRRPGSNRAQARGGTAPHNGEAGLGYGLADSWINFPQKPQHCVFIRVPIHRAHKDNVPWLWLMLRIIVGGMEEIGIHSGWKRRDVVDCKFALHGMPIVFRHREHVVE